MAEVVVTVTLVEPSGSTVGPAMIKGVPSVTLSDVVQCFCGWAGLTPAAVGFALDGVPLDAARLALSLEQAGLRSGSAIVAQLVDATAQVAASARAAPFAMLDVDDCDLADALGGMETT